MVFGKESRVRPMGQSQVSNYNLLSDCDIDLQMKMTEGWFCQGVY